MINNYTIGILTYARTGSNFLGQLFCTQENLYLSELYCVDYLQFFRKIHSILRKHKVGKEILRTFIEIYDRDRISNYIKSYPLYENEIAAQDIYSKQLLIDFKNHAYNLQQNLVFKIFNEHFKKDISHQSIVDLCDFIIINYRKNILATFLSLQKAKANDNWCKINGYKKSFEPQLNKIIWNTSEYLAYYEDIKLYLQNIYLQTINQSKKHIILSYEEIHSLGSFQTKRDYISTRLIELNIKPTISNEEIFLRQTLTDVDNIEYISNIKDFEKDRSHLPLIIEQSDFT